MGTCVLGSMRQVRAAVGPRQFGVGRGPEQIVAEVRAAAALRPDHAIVSLDFKNAFGMVRWSDALLGTVASAPRLATPLACLWQPGEVNVMVQRENGLQWEAMPVTGGLVQGFVEASPVFCMVLAGLMRKVHSDPQISRSDWDEILEWAYIDDWTLQVPPRLVPALSEVIQRHAADLGFELQPHKCQVHVPSERGKAECEWRDTTKQAAAVMPVSSCGVTLLGTEAAGDIATPLDTQLAAHTAAKRLQKAEFLGKRALETLQLAPPAGARHAVWALTRSVISQALAYDFRVLPCALSVPHAERLEEVVNAVMSRILLAPVDKLDPGQQMQLGLPVRCAGLQMTPPTLLAPLARAAALLEGGPALRAAVEGWPGGSPQLACTYDGVDEALREDLPGRLKKIGIRSFAGDGRPSADLIESDPAVQVTRAGSTHASARAANFRPPVPCRHLLSSMLRFVADTKYSSLLKTADVLTSARLRSAAGPTAGTSLVAPLSTQGISFSDAEWTGALRWRLGMPPVGQQQSTVALNLCRNWNAAKATYCDAVLDAHGNHAAICPCGPLTILCHEALADRWADIAEEAGAVIRRELYVPALSNPTEETWLDIATFGGGALAGRLLDVIVRHPGAEIRESSCEC